MESLETATVWPIARKESSASTCLKQAFSMAAEDPGYYLYLLGRNMNILTFQENQIVYGKGGGYCSTCEPDHYREPKLDVLPYWMVEQQFRFMPTGV